MQPETNRKDIIFYDGTCGLCHGFVKWTLQRDAQGAFQFAPLQGETVAKLVPSDKRASLPDSIIVLTAGGIVLTKSAAAKYVADRTGRGALATFLQLMPRWLADFGYNIIAKTRYAIFGRKQEMCPVVPPQLRERFLP